MTEIIIFKANLALSDDCSYDSLLTSLAAFISAWRFVRLCKIRITIHREGQNFDLTDMELYFMFIPAAPQAAMKVYIFPSQHRYAAGDKGSNCITTQQSHLSAIRVNLTVRFNFFDVNSGVPFLDFWKSAHFTEQSIIYQWVISTSELDCFSVEMSCTRTYSAK